MMEKKPNGLAQVEYALILVVLFAMVVTAGTVFRDSIINCFLTMGNIFTNILGS